MGTSVLRGVIVLSERKSSRRPIRRQDGSISMPPTSENDWPGLGITPLAGPVTDLRGSLSFCAMRLVVALLGSSSRHRGLTAMARLALMGYRGARFSHANSTRVKFGLNPVELSMNILDLRRDVRWGGGI